MKITLQVQILFRAPFMEKNPKPKLQLGIIGKHNNKCCRGWCLDCEVIRRKTFKAIEEEYKRGKMK
jgi:hypothetical protein